MSKIQYTIRNIPEETDKKLRNRAKRYGKSFNSVVIETLNKELFGTPDVTKKIKKDVFERLRGANTLDKGFFDAIEEQSKIDPELWK